MSETSANPAGGEFKASRGLFEEFKKENWHTQCSKVWASCQFRKMWG